jgi:hypothetical protein
VVFDNKIWVIGGSPDGSNYLNDVWSSADGKNWEQIKPDDANGFPKRANHEVVVFDDGKGEKMWLIGGSSNIIYDDVWNSTDGKTWNPVTNAAGLLGRTAHTAEVFNDGSGEKMWVIAGLTNDSDKSDAWSSTNGKTWTTATTNAGFSKRRHHSSVVFNDRNGEKMWVISGNVNGSQENDVWSSADGKTWNDVRPGDNSNDEFPGRERHTSEAFDGKMWAIAGFDRRLSADGGGYQNALWSSTNGKDWTEDTVDSSKKFSARQDHSSVVFQEKLWVIGGNGNGGSTNDVWSMERD